jgi:hypothetical protein
MKATPSPRRILSVSLIREACQLDAVVRSVEDVAVTDRFSDPAWWPTPRPRPQQPVGGQLVWMLVPLLAIGGTVVALTLLFAPHHATGPRAPHAPACAHAGAPGCQAEPTPAEQAQSRAQAEHEELESCLRQSGVGSGGGGVGLFRRGPSAQSREAMEVCRSVLRGGSEAPAVPTPTSAALPVA